MSPEEMRNKANQVSDDLSLENLAIRSIIKKVDETSQDKIRLLENEVKRLSNENGSLRLESARLTAELSNIKRMIKIINE